MSELEDEQQLRSYLQRAHELSDANEIIENLVNATNYLAEKSQNTKTSSLDGNKS